jgi:hypothetical protein
VLGCVLVVLCVCSRRRVSFGSRGWFCRCRLFCGFLFLSAESFRFCLLVGSCVRGLVGRRFGLIGL